MQTSEQKENNYQNSRHIRNTEFQSDTEFRRMH